MLSISGGMFLIDVTSYYNYVTYLTNNLYPIET